VPFKADLLLVDIYRILRPAVDRGEPLDIDALKALLPKLEAANNRLAPAQRYVDIETVEFKGDWLENSGLRQRWHDTPEPVEVRSFSGAFARGRANDFVWSRRNEPDDIVHYRLLDPTKGNPYPGSRVDADGWVHRLRPNAPPIYSGIVKVEADLADGSTVIARVNELIWHQPRHVKGKQVVRYRQTIEPRTMKP